MNYKTKSIILQTSSETNILESEIDPNKKYKSYLSSFGANFRQFMKDTMKKKFKFIFVGQGNYIQRQKMFDDYIRSAAWLLVLFSRHSSYLWSNEFFLPREE